MDMRTVQQVIAGLILSGIILMLHGCAIDSVRDGVDATDFSDVYVGMMRADFERLTGSQIELNESDGCVAVTYEYDRGYIGCLASGRCQELSTGEEAFGYASYAFVMIATVGGIQWITWYEINDCQTGYLRACYDSDNKLMSIKLLDPDPYKKGTYLWEKDIRKPWLDRPCRHVYYHPQPCTIPAEVLVKDGSLESRQ